MGHFGFSYVGAFYLLLLFTPNFIFIKCQPAGYRELPAKEPLLLLWLERAGQVCTTCCAVVFSDFNLFPLSLWSLWLLGSFLLMLLYEVCWVRYFKGSHALSDFYRGFLGIPAPLAVLPVAAFFLLGIYGRVVWMLLSAVLLGVGHIGIHLRHRKELREMEADGNASLPPR